MRTTTTTLLTLLTSLSIAACATSADRAPGGGGGKADGDECPVEGDADAVLAAIEQAGTCYNAANLAEACAYGSNIDRGLVDAATKVCATGFGEMSDDDAAIYEDLLQRCDAKYADQAGSMYRSFAAHCQLEVTRAFNWMYPRPEVPTDDEVSVERSCPAQTAYVLEAIGSASSCGGGADIAENCAIDSGAGDLAMAEAAAEHCVELTGDLDDDYIAMLDQLTVTCEKLVAEDEELGPLMSAYCQLQIRVAFDTILSSGQD